MAALHNYELHGAMGSNKRASEPIGLTYGNRKHFGFPEFFLCWWKEEVRTTKFVGFDIYHDI